MKRKSANLSGKNKELELRRQAIHALGILAVPIILFVERPAATIMLGGLLILLISLSTYRAKRAFQVKWLETFVLKRERPDVFPLSGAVFFFLGTFCAFLLYAPIYAAAAVAVLALGDSASTLVGKFHGRHKIFFNRSKSWEGSATFFALALIPLLFFVSPQRAALVAFLTMLVEALPKIDDNFSIPVAAGLFLTLIQTV